MKKILITGANGQLGQCLLHIPGISDEVTWIPTDFPELDITNDEMVESRIRTDQPDMLVNCAAYTAVDLAEKEPEKAMAINGYGPGILARSARKFSIPFIHISTDYVFSGQSWHPYTESDPTGPLSYYGRTKLAGELEVRNSGSGIILRTSWLYSEYGKNFLLTMVRLGKEKESLGVVMDQIGCPTYAGDLANAIVAVIRNIIIKPDLQDSFHLYHFCNTGVASWYDFASIIMRKAGLPCRVNPIRTEDYPLPAVRPSYSVLDTSLFSKSFDFTIPYWQDSFDQCLEKVLHQK